MSINYLQKSTNKLNEKINKQYELDELDQLDEELNMCTITKNDDMIKRAYKQKPTPIIKNFITKESDIDSLSINPEPIDKRKGINVISAQLSEKTSNLNSKSKPLLQKIFIKHEKSQKIIDESSDLYDNLEVDLLPKNYGNKWSDEDKNKLIELLKISMGKEINYDDIALKLGRSCGGVKGEIKKMIIKRYLNGEEADLIAIDLNIQYKFVKILIKSYIDNEIENDIFNFEKENKFLKLKIENMELRKNMKKIINIKD